MAPALPRHETVGVEVARIALMKALGSIVGRVCTFRARLFLVGARGTEVARRAAIAIVVGSTGGELLLALTKANVACLTRLAFEIGAELVGVGPLIALHTPQVFIDVMRVVAGHLAGGTPHRLLHSWLTVSPMRAFYRDFCFLRAVECLGALFAEAVALRAIAASRARPLVLAFVRTDGSRGAEDWHDLPLCTVRAGRAVVAFLSCPSVAMVGTSNAELRRGEDLTSDAEVSWGALVGGGIGDTAAVAEMSAEVLASDAIFLVVLHELLVISIEGALDWLCRGGRWAVHPPRARDSHWVTFNAIVACRTYFTVSILGCPYLCSDPPVRADLRMGGSLQTVVP